MSFQMIPTTTITTANTTIDSLLGAGYLAEAFSLKVYGLTPSEEIS